MVLRTLEEINIEFLFERISPYDGAKAGATGTAIAEKKPAQILPPFIKSKLRLPVSLLAVKWPRPRLPRLPKIWNKSKDSGPAAIISSALFYLAILILLLTTVLAGGDSGAPKMILGYSYFTVLTSSMQDEIPQGSFILVRRVEARDLQAGDNITYMRDAATSVTHKIVQVYENYDNSGMRGFQTQGVNNEHPDNDIVSASNVLGKVVMVLPAVGATIMNLRANIQLVFIVFGLFVILSFCIRWLSARPGKQHSTTRSQKTAAS
jgi:signal peptidase